MEKMVGRRIWEDEPRPVISIRHSTAEERKMKSPPLIPGRRRIRIPKYVVFPTANPDFICSVFGLPQGGDTRREAVFWAERYASKQDRDYQPPAGWENVKGELPDD